MAELHTLLEVADGIAQITLNRPERMNAFTWQMGQEVNDHLLALDADDAVRAIVVTGAGRAYCAGADMGGGDKTFSDVDSAGGSTRSEDGPPQRPIQPWQVRKPIIAAINGHAIGVGLTMPLQYDLRIAARDAKLQFAFVRRGIVAELASTYILPRLVGVARAADLLMTGRIVTGEEAAALGFVNEAVERDEVLPRARQIAAEIRDHTAPASVALTKRLMWEHLNVDDPLVAAKREARGLAKLGRMPDAAEGVMSFLEKRPPQWKLTASDAPEVD
ncbi:MAG: enoyl-CoA hydratase-related protein [Myxococcota bacterium]|nr:enoyl-CoA hydratase-related protein [Myxococcota bacterium]